MKARAFNYLIPINLKRAQAHKFHGKIFMLARGSKDIFTGCCLLVVTLKARAHFELKKLSSLHLEPKNEPENEVAGVTN